MSTEPTSKPVFSFKELVYIMALISGYLMQQSTMKQEINAAVASIKADKEIVNLQLAVIKKDIDVLNGRYDFLVRRDLQVATKPKEIKIETE